MIAPKTFLKHFDTIAEAPGGIQRLRELILDLAVRGKLVPQDPGDDPAKDTILRMREKREKWFIKHEGTSSEYKRMLKKTSSLKPPQSPFPVPLNWACSHLIDLSLITVDCHNKTAPTQEEGIPLIRTSNIRNGKLNVSGVKYVSEETYGYFKYG